MEQAENAALALGKREGSAVSSGRSSVIQKAVVCISFSGSSSFPSPIFSLVKNLIFLKPITCERTSTSPCARGWRGPGDAFFFRDFEHAHLRVADRVGVVIDVHRLHVGLALVEIELVDVILLALMKVNRFRVHGRERGGKIHFADHFGLAVLLAAVPSSRQTCR